MRDTFAAFYRPSNEQIQQAWADAIFVLDTNILLNLYRYPKNARTELLEVLRTLQARIWIPFHVGMEFQRNRLTVIAGQQKRFSELKKELDSVGTMMRTKIANLQLKKRHAVIDVEPILARMDGSLQGFAKLLDDLKQKDDLGFDVDPIRDQLDNLLAGKVGPAPSVEMLKSIQTDGEHRFKHGAPPGFADADKEKRNGATYMFQGLQYEAKFGDLIVWRQIIEHAKRNQLKALIFLTDDEKEDWWQIVDADGPKKIGPRPELRDEIRREAGVEFFHMYNSENFLTHAKKFILPNVQQESIEEVAGVLREERAAASIPFVTPLALNSDAGKWVQDWIIKRGFTIQNLLMEEAALVFRRSSDVNDLTLYVAIHIDSLDEVFDILAESAAAAASSSTSKLMIVVGIGQETHDAARRWFASFSSAKWPEGHSLIYGRIQHPTAPSGGSPYFLPLSGIGNTASELMHG